MNIDRLIRRVAYAELLARFFPDWAEDQIDQCRIKVQVEIARDEMFADARDRATKRMVSRLTHRSVDTFDQAVAETKAMLVKARSRSLDSTRVRTAA